jgi:hypothetical protein
MASDTDTTVNEIWSKITKKVTVAEPKTTPTGCWEYNGSRKNGYGVISHKGKLYNTHRVSFEYWHQRPIAPKMFILHACDNEACCNPEHLREGNHKDNTADTRSRDRFTKIKPEKKTGIYDRDEYRGYIIYEEESFLLLSSEKTRQIHKIDKTSTTPLPVVGQKYNHNGTELSIERNFTPSSVFSACREYCYDLKRKNDHYNKKKEEYKKND